MGLRPCTFILTFRTFRSAAGIKTAWLAEVITRPVTTQGSTLTRRKSRVSVQADSPASSTQNSTPGNWRLSPAGSGWTRTGQLIVLVTPKAADDIRSPDFGPAA